MNEIDTDGPTVILNDGTEWCLAVYLGGENRAVGRAAVPPGTYSVSDAVDSVEYLDSMAGFSEYPVADAYRDQP